MNRIKKLRKSKDMTQDDLAKLLNVQRSVVSKYESEIVPLTNDTIKKLANIFCVSVDYLLGIDGDTTSSNNKKEPAPEAGSAEWLKQGLIARGHKKLPDEHIKLMLVNLDALANALEQNGEK